MSHEAMEDAHRTFKSGRRIFLGDASTTGRLRLDALAQYLQDLATNDADDANLDHGRGWILRRMVLDVHRLPTIYEDVELTTWCSGVGGRWAERSTQIADTRALDGGMCAVARAVWVYVNLDTGQPLSLPESFFAVYGEDVKKHKISARLQHCAPSVEAKRRPWPLRVADFDIFGHVNNAIYWSAIEDELAGWLDGRRIGHCEMEFRAGVDPGDEPDLLIDPGDGKLLTVWFMVGDEIRASAQVSPQ